MNARRVLVIARVPLIHVGDEVCSVERSVDLISISLPYASQKGCPAAKKLEIGSIAARCMVFKAGSLHSAIPKRFL